jgi:hypothetical protein
LSIHVLSTNPAKEFDETIKIERTKKKQKPAFDFIFNLLGNAFARWLPLLQFGDFRIRIGTTRSSSFFI